MKKITSILLLITIILSTITVTTASENTEQTKYFFINKCEEIQFKMTFLDGKPRGAMLLIDPLGNSYNTWVDEFAVKDNSYIYTIKNPPLGKWTLIFDYFTWDDVKFEMIEKNREGEPYDERFGMPYISTPTEYNMRKHYIQLESYNNTVLETIKDRLFDIKPSYWAAPYIAKLNYLGIVNGRNGMFMPEDSVKVNEFIKMVVYAMGYDLPLDKSNWALEYINKAKEIKLIDENEYQNYELPITREQAAQMMVRATGLKEDLPDKNLVNEIYRDIKDYNVIEDYKKDNVCTSYAIGLITGMDGYFKPKSNLTRAQASTIIMRYIDRALRQPYVPVALRNVKAVTLPNNQGELVKVYPSEYKEIIDTAIKLDEARKLSKGANYMNYISHQGLITTWFYKDEESKLRGTCTKSNEDIELLNMAIDIYTANNKEHSNIIYKIDISEIEEAKNIHIEAIKEMFKFWFKDEYQKPYDKLIEFMDTDTKGEYMRYENTYNGRRMSISKSAGISVKVYTQ